MSISKPIYRGRLAPTPTGSLHAGHAATFWRAYERAREREGELILRIEDLDAARCRPEYVEGVLEDFRWLGIEWSAGPFFQSQRRELYLEAWRRLRDGGFIYPSAQSRKDVEQAVTAPHEEEPIFPIAWRVDPAEARKWETPAGIAWRFRVPEGETISFTDGREGPVSKIAGTDFGDFVIWSRDDIPAYELAVVVDDAAMGITEVVRGADLLVSTCRQLLLYRALGAAPPAFYHCPLILDEQGRRLAKRHAALTLKALRVEGKTPADVLRQTLLG